MNNARDAARFLHALWMDPPPPNLRIPILRLPSRLTDWEASLVALGDLESENTYFHVAAHDPEVRQPGGPSPHMRGTTESAHLIPALWVDIDTADGMHSAEDLPIRDDVYELLDALEPKRSALIDSGGGVHAYWFLDKPVDITDKHNRDRLLRILRVLTHELQGDPSVADMARVMRLPGTLNHKTTPPRSVRIIDLQPGVRYTLEELEAWAKDKQTPPSTHENAQTSKADAQEASKHCAWLAHVREDAAILPEPEWQAALTIVAHCQDSSRIAHKWSSAYPGYSQVETQKKLQKAEESFRPRTCDWVASHTNSTWCVTCQHRGKITSPIQLGRPRREHAVHAAALHILQAAVVAEDPATALYQPEVLSAAQWIRTHAAGEYAEVRESAKAVEGLSIGQWERAVKGGDAREFASRHGESPFRPDNAVEVVPGQLPMVIERSAELLATANSDHPVVYQLGGVLVYIAASGDEPARTVVVTPHWMRLAASRHVHYIVPKEKGDVRIDCPANVATMMVEDAGGWPFPKLEGIVGTPTLRPDGTLISREGYDPATKLYFHAGGTKFPSIPERPTKAAARTALDRVIAAFDEVPFVDEVARSVALSAALCSVARRAIPLAPLYHIDASTQATGKTTFCQAIGILATGEPPPVAPKFRDEEEARKCAMAILMDGAPVALIDNVDGDLDSATLCRLLTSEKYRDRVLGTSRMATVSTRILWLSNGNNVSVVGDLVSRTLICRLDRGVERPEQHAYVGDLIATAKNHRATIVCDLLTVIRAYFAAGEPSLDIPDCRMREWSRFARAPLVWLGEPDPLESQLTLRESDPALESLESLLSAWYSQLGSEQVTAAALLAESRNPSGPPDDPSHVLRDTLWHFCGAGLETEPSSVKVGRVLRSLCNRPTGGLVLRRSDGTHGGKRLWHVVPTDDSPPVIQIRHSSGEPDATQNLATTSFDEDASLATAATQTSGGSAWIPEHSDAVEGGTQRLDSSAAGFSCPSHSLGTQHVDNDDESTSGGEGDDDWQAWEEVFGDG